MELSLSFSPCPNDTYIFHAMINSLVDTEGLTFNLSMADVEELNLRAIGGKLDICKLSYHAYFSMVDKYIMLRSGSALGYNNGPLLVKKLNSTLPETPLIAIPGSHTTAALLLKTAYPQYNNLKPMLFSNIEKEVLNGNVDAGVLIHEGRFTYKEKGLELICDLGEYWQSNFNHPIPLGGIAVNRNLSAEVQQKINRVLNRSIKYANLHPMESAKFITENAQEIEEKVQKSHIALFVNNFTLDIEKEGEDAVQFMYEKFLSSNREIADNNELYPLFID